MPGNPFDGTLSDASSNPATSNPFDAQNASSSSANPFDATNTPEATQAATAVATKTAQGSGLTGFLGRAGGDVINAAKGLAPGIESAAMEPVRLARGIGEYAKESALGQPISNEAAVAPGLVNTVAHVFSLGKLGGYGEKQLGGQQNESATYNPDKFVSGVAGGLEQTGREIAHPTQAVKNYAAHPVASFLNDASTVATVATLGGAAAAGLAGVGEGAEAGSLAARAGAVGEAAQSGLERAGALANRAANPIQEGVARVAGRVAASPTGQAFGKQIADLRARSQVAALREATLGNLAADVRQQVGTRVQELNKLVPDRTEQGTAAILSMGWVDGAGAAEKLDAALKDPQVRPVIESYLDDRNTALTGTYGAKAADAAITMPMLEQAVDHRLGRLPAEDAARLDAGEKFYRDLATQHEQLAQQAGIKEETLKNEPTPLSTRVQEETGVAAARNAKVQDIRSGLEQRVADLGLIKKGQTVEDATKEAKQNVSKLKALAAREQKADAAQGVQSLLARFQAERDDALAHTSVTGPQRMSALRQLAYMQQHPDQFTPEQIASIHDSTIQALQEHQDQQRRVDDSKAAIQNLQQRVAAARSSGTGIVSPETQAALSSAQEHADLLDQYRRAGPLAERTQQRLSEAQAKAGELLNSAPAAYRPALGHWRDLTSALSLAAERALSQGDALTAEKLEGVSKDFQEFGKLRSFQNPLGEKANFIRENATLPSGDVSPSELHQQAVQAGAPAEGNPGEMRTVPFDRGTLPGLLNGHAIVHYGADGKIDGSLIVTDAGAEVGVSSESQRQGIGQSLVTAGERAGYDMKEALGAGGFTPEGAALAYSRENPTQPAYMRGGLARKGLAATGAGVSAKAQRPGFTRQKISNVTETTFAGQFRKNLEDYTKYARGVLANTAADKFGVKPSSLDDVKGLPFGEMRDAMQERGMVPWDPKYGSNVPAGAITHDTPFMTPEMAKALDNQLNGAFSKGGVGHLFDKLTQATYRDWLKISPFYMAHMIGSDALLAATKGMTPADMIHYGTQARELLKNNQAPGALLGSKIDEESLIPKIPNSGLLGRAQGAYARFTSVPRVVDELTRVAVYLRDIDKEGMSPEDAIGDANKALGHLNTLGPVEQTLVRRVFPVYPWMKQVAEVAAKLAHDHPLGAVWTLNLGEQASQKQENGLPTFLQGFDPARLLSINPLNLVNPVVRAAAGAGLGLNLASHRLVTEAGRKSGALGPMSAKGGAYFAEHQFPLGKLVEPLTQTPNLRRNDAGQIVFNPKTRQPEPSSYPSNFPTALKNFLFGQGFGSTAPKPGSALAKSQAKTKKAAATAATKRVKETALAARRGVH